MKTTIKMWAEDDRPREKMQRIGSRALSDAEILAIIIGAGTRYLTAVELAQELLRKYNNDLRLLARQSLEDLRETPGIGLAKAVGIQAALELGKRKSELEPQRRLKVMTSKTSYRLFKPYLADLNHEEFYVLYLDHASYKIDLRLLSKGGTANTVVDGKILFREALMLRASQVVLAHNHPSGRLVPSERDITLTRSLTDFGKLVGIHVLDHLIISDNDYFSFSDKNTL